MDSEFSQTDRKKDGWHGPVKSIIVEVANYIQQASETALGTPFPILTYAYDASGRRVGDMTFHKGANVVQLDSHFTSSWRDPDRIESQRCYTEEGLAYTVRPTYRDDKIVKETFFDNHDIAKYAREYTYDSAGHPVEMSHVTAEGIVLRKLNYENRYDDRGNLVEVAVYEWTSNQPTSRPLMVIYYTITYFSS